MRGTATNLKVQFIKRSIFARRHKYNRSLFVDVEERKKNINVGMYARTKKSASRGFQSLYCVEVSTVCYMTHILN